MIWDACKLIFSTLTELTISLVTLPMDVIRPKRSSSVCTRMKSREQHNADIARIASRLIAVKREDPDVQVAISRNIGEGYSTRSYDYKKGKYQVDISSLKSILEINVEEKYAEVEALVTFEQLCTVTLKHGLLPAVVPEFKSMTIGGAVQGLGIESTSWMYGSLDQTVIDATLITGHGNIINSSEVPDLWEAVPGSNGTLALLVSVRIRLIDATSWIRLKYVYYSEPSAFLAEVERKFIEKTDFSWIGNDQVIDGIIFCNTTDDQGATVAVYGGCVLEPESDLPIYYESPFSLFFYQRVKNMLLRKKELSNDDIGPIVLHEEYMPKLQYLFRYDRGAFWAIEILKTVFPPSKILFKFPFLVNLLTSLLKIATIKRIGFSISEEKRESLSMIQDVSIPIENAQDIVEWAINQGLERIWLCPVRSHQSEKRLFKISQRKNGLSMNVGMYGFARDLPQANLNVQRSTAKLNGKTGLYSYIYANRDEFWSWYDHEEYIRLRNKWGGNLFMDLWDKVASRTARNSTLE